MAFPQGISQAAMRLKRENGTADTWLAEHKKQKEAGTLEAWLATQNDLTDGQLIKLNSTVKQPAKRRNPIEALFEVVNRAQNAIIDWRHDDLQIEDLEQVEILQTEIISLGNLAEKWRNDLFKTRSRLRREHELQAENIEKANRIAELEAQLAQAEEKLRVTGHSEPVTVSRANKKLTLKVADSVA